MAWSTPMTAVDNAALTAAQWNASVRDNLLETAVGKATTAGAHFAVTGTNAIAQRVTTQSVVDTLQTTPSQTYTGMATTGPVVTVTTGVRALVFHAAQMENDTANIATWSGLNVNGATPDDNLAIVMQAAVSAAHSPSRCNLFTLTAGSNTFTMQYRVSAPGGTGSFSRRRLQVMPL